MDNRKKILSVNHECRQFRLRIVYRPFADADVLLISWRLTSWMFKRRCPKGVCQTAGHKEALEEPMPCESVDGTVPSVQAMDARSRLALESGSDCRQRAIEPSSNVCSPGSENIASTNRNGRTPAFPNDELILSSRDSGEPGFKPTTLSITCQRVGSVEMFAD